MVKKLQINNLQNFNNTKKQQKVYNKVYNVVYWNTQYQTQMLRNATLVTLNIHSRM